MRKLYTSEDLNEVAIDTLSTERNRIRVIIEYICNKNSKPLSQGGVDYETLFDDIQDLEHSLLD